MTYQPPVGARDLFPLDVAQKVWIEARLQQVFHQWGYHRIITSTLERLDTLMAGGAIDQSTVLQVHGTEEQGLGLRPELTASIARAAVTRMAGMAFPARLYYNANVFRRPAAASHNRQQEFFQAGVELLGQGGVGADAEMLLLLSDCLRKLGMQQWYLLIGEAGLSRSLLSVFPEKMQGEIRRAIAHLDRMALEALPLSPDLRDRALLLLDLRGQPKDVLQTVAQLDLGEEQRQTIANLKTLVELLQDSFAASPDQAHPALILDLSLMQTFDYYTGIVFEAVNWGASGQRVLGQGGRYDQLLGLYHPDGQTYPGVGFSLNIEDLHHVMLTNGRLPLDTPASHWLVVPESPGAYAAAFSYAQTLRDASSADAPQRVEVDLRDRGGPEAVRAYARQQRIQQIAWISATGDRRVEPLDLAP
jgi:ATP phosphoribosyltransferase regulatory subunit